MIESLRKFWLENESGELFPLNAEQKVLLLNPTGFGLDANESFAVMGDGFYVDTAQEYDKQKTLGGDFLFLMPRPRDTYTNFANWLLSAKALTLVYMPTSTAYRRRIKVASIDKDEIDHPGDITVPISFITLSPWYADDVDTFTLGISSDGFRAMDEADIDESFIEAPLDIDEESLVLDGGEGLEVEGDEPEAETNAESRVWDETTPEDDCTWQRLTETDVLSDGFIIAPRGHLPSSINLKFSGTASNPTIYVIGVNTGTEYGRCAVAASIAGSETLEYSTDVLDSYIRKTSGGTVRDLINAVDVRYNVFPRLPITEPCRVAITSDGAIDGSLSVSVHRYLRGV